MKCQRCGKVTKYKGRFCGSCFPADHPLTVLKQRAYDARRCRQLHEVMTAAVMLRHLKLGGDTHVQVPIGDLQAIFRRMSYLEKRA